jgi:RHS repeat-associated protein
MSVPIYASEGRSGFGPKLSLSYDSGAGNGPFGLGWSLSLPSITRKTDKGLPQYVDATQSDTFILSGAEDLVPALVWDGSQWRRDDSQRILYAQSYVVRRFRPRVDAVFARIERWSNSHDPRDVFWRSISNDNITTWYGKSSDSRIADPADPSRIFSWLISESYDDTGNACCYVYKSEDSVGVDVSQANERNRTVAGRSANRYLKRALWGNRSPYAPDLSAAQAVALPAEWCFELVFDYGEHDPNMPVPQEGAQLWTCRPDAFSTYRSTFEVRSYRLCRRALMFHHFKDEPGVGLNCLVRSTDFAYALPQADSVSPFYSCLESITQIGYRRADAGYLTKSMPPLEFDYSQAALDETVHELDAESLENLPQADGATYQWIDLDGEGSPGILSEQGGAWFYKPNWSAKSGGARFGPVEVVARRPSLAALASGRQQLTDLAGDGNQDLVQFEGPTPGFFERTDERGWKGFTAFASLPTLDWRSPNLKFVDLTGDGHADLLISEDSAFRWHPSLAQEGFGEARRVVQSRDEETAPKVLFSDATQTIFLGDVSGDGLSDIVRVRNGEVCYWPNLGYGRFGAKIAMDGAPRFDRPELFDARRIRLTDIDGSGTADIVYFARDEVHLYFNQSGNSWGARRKLAHFPEVETASVATALDLLGNGTACLVWSSLLAGNARHPIRYIDLMGGQKPHLLVGISNNLGAETRIEYAPSTKFYVADKLAGTPWLTRVAFPVQVVERVETYDYVSRSVFVTRYAYHHGYFDAEEREFRGFGRVDQWDTEEFAALSGSAALPEAANVEATSHLPPVCTRTWFHTGAYFGEGRVSKHLEAEYYQEGLDATQLEAMLLDDTVLPDSILLPDGSRLQQQFSPEELREACRALRGSILRQEIYAEDPSDAANRPFRVSERNYTIEAVQPRGPNRFAAFFSHAREVIDLHYERKLYGVNDRVVADPRVAHTLILDVDAFGNVLESASVSYGRRYADSGLIAADQAKQNALACTYTTKTYTKPILGDDAYRAPMAAETITYELIQVQPDSSQSGITNLFRFDELSSKARAAADGHHDIPYETVHPQGLNAGEAYRRLISRTRTLYRPDDMGTAAGDAKALLPLGVLEPLALPGDTYRLAFTPGLIAKVYQRGGALLPTPASVFNSAAGDGGGYVDLDRDGHWWIPSGRIFYLDAPDTPQNERARAVPHFFLRRRFENPFGQATAVNHDVHDLLPVNTLDATGNSITAVNDYRVLQPVLITDANGNQSAGAFDALGLLAGTAAMGKPGENLGDSLVAFDPDLTQTQIDGFHDAADPGTLAVALLAKATNRVVNDVGRFYESHTASPDDPTKWYPAYAATIARETHASDLGAGQQSALQINFSYSDGFGREVQKKAQAEPGPVVDAGPTIDPRWTGSGWTVFDNKGNAVRKYEPFFSRLAKGHQFEFGIEIGVSPIVFYDPVGRAVATLHPNHTYQKMLFDPWRQETWDPNDTVLQADPTGDPDIGDYFRRLPATDYSPTWHAQRLAGALGTSEKDAAVKTEAHANTPATAHLDSLGRTFLQIADNAVAGKLATRIELDIQGNQLSVTDPLGRLAAVYDYNMTGSRIHMSSMEAGARWTLDDAAGKAIRAWDDRGHNFRSSYDALRRPTGLFVLGTDSSLSDPRTLSAEAQYEKTVYGEGQPSDRALNLRSRVFQHFDCAGLAANEAYDFKGNVLRASRQFLVDFQALPNWDSAPALASETFASSTTFDALNRPLASTTPDASVTQFGYNVAGYLERIDGKLEGAAAMPFVTNIDYDARGRRIMLSLGNSAATSYGYDPLTQRLLRLTTTRKSVPANQSVVQDLTYTYDPSGNITHLQDDADIQNTVFFRNRRVDPSNDYAYDAIYRLVSAKGREYLAPATTSYNDSPRRGLTQPGDGNAIGSYTEQYDYDIAGNLQRLTHRGVDDANPGWSRTYTFDEPSLLEPARKNNRLTRTTIQNGGTSVDETYAHDTHGNMTAMPQLQSMTWDFQDRLIQTRRQAVNSSDADGAEHQGERTFYLYDAGGNRARKVTLRQNGTLKSERLYLSGCEFYREYDGAGTTITLERRSLHVMDDKHRVALVESKTIDAGAAADSLPATTTRYQFGNHLDSAALELDESGAVISYEEYYPFGSTSYQAGRSTVEVSLKRYRYTGKERDTETGLQYNRSRYYACWLGRWTATDPLGVADGPNLYSYVNDNPVVLQDVNGTDGNAPLHPNDPAPKVDQPPNTTTVTVTDPNGKETSTTTPNDPAASGSDPNAKPAVDDSFKPPIYLSTSFGQPWQGVPYGYVLHEYTMGFNLGAGTALSRFALTGSGGLGGWLGTFRYGFKHFDVGPLAGVSLIDSAGNGVAGGFAGGTLHVPIDLQDWKKDYGIGIYLAPLITFTGPLAGPGPHTGAGGGSVTLSFGHEPDTGSSWDANATASYASKGSFNYPGAPLMSDFWTAGGLLTLGKTADDKKVSSSHEVYLNYVAGSATPQPDGSMPGSGRGARFGYGYNRQWNWAQGADQTNGLGIYAGVMGEYAHIQPTPGAGAMSAPAVDAFTVMFLFNVTIGANVKDRH